MSTLVSSSRVTRLPPFTKSIVTVGMGRAILEKFERVLDESQIVNLDMTTRVLVGQRQLRARHHQPPVMRAGGGTRDTIDFDELSVP